MRVRSYFSEGIVLARKNWGEADRILVVYSKHFGKLRLLAKGVRKPKSRKRGHIEVFSRMKFSTTRGKGLDIITEAEIIDNYLDVRKDLKKIAVCYFLMETIGRVVHDEEKNELLYAKLLESLEELKQSSYLKTLRNEFIYDVLVILGFWPFGKPMDNPDKTLEDVIERIPSSVRIGKKLLS